jgi:hypothetical protein
MDLPSHASSHGFGAAMTNEDTNKETAPPPNDASASDLGSVLNGVLNHSVETLTWLEAINHRCEDRSSSNGKLYFARPSSICSR